MSFPASIAEMRPGAYDIDEWGLDHDLVGLLDPLLPLRWDVEVDGADRLPADGPALVD